MKQRTMDRTIRQVCKTQELLQKPLCDLLKASKLLNSNCGQYRTKLEMKGVIGNKDARKPREVIHLYFESETSG